MDIMDMKKELGEKQLEVILLTIITGLFYNVIWFLERYKTFNTIAKKEIISRNWIIGMAVLLGLHYLSIIMTDYGGPLVIPFFIVTVATCFRVANALEAYYTFELHQNLKFNRVLLVIFNVFYINYFFMGLERVAPIEPDLLLQTSNRGYYHT